MIKIYTELEFGIGTLTIGCAKIPEEEERWYITIRSLLGEPKEVGTKVTSDDINKESSEVYLVFPTEKQMLTVHGALVNKTYEEMKGRWDKTAPEREAKEWVAKVEVKS